MTSVFFPQTIDLSASAIQLIRTALANPHVVLDKNGLRATDASGAVTFSLDALSGDIRGGKLLLGTDSPWLEWLRDITQAEPVEGGGNLAGQIEVGTLFASVGGSPVPEAEMTLRVLGGTQQAELDLQTGGTAHPALSQLLVSLGVSGGAVQRLIIDGTGASDFVQKTDTTYVKSQFPGSYQPVMDRPVGVYRAGAAYGAAAGWQNLAVDTYDYDGVNWDGMWNGSSFIAPVTGWYDCFVRVGMTNNTGAAIEIAVGRTSVESFNLGYVASTQQWTMEGQRTVYLGAGAPFNPGFYASATGGFGVAVYDVRASFRRVA